MSCECDTRIHPKPLDIQRGLANVPRTIGRFDDFRAAMWAGRASKPALRDWSRQAPGDLGAMLVDMWAVVADVQAFYDEVRANEAYINTAPTRDILTALIARLGYRPRPTTAASAWIALEVGGLKNRRLPGGTAFRSGPVAGGPPQVFETGADQTLYPVFGALSLEPSAAQNLAQAQGMSADAGDIAGLWVDPKSLNAAVGDTLVLEANGDLSVTRLVATRREIFGDDKPLIELSFDPAPSISPASVAPGGVRILKTVQSSRLWSATAIAGDPAVRSSTSVVLNFPNTQIAPGDIVTLTGSDGSLSVSRATTAREVKMTLSAATTITATDEDDEEFDIDVPAIFAPATRLTFETSMTSGGADQDAIFGFGTVIAATLATPPSDSFTPSSSAALPISNSWRLRRRWQSGEEVSVHGLMVDPFGQGGPAGAVIDPIGGDVQLGDDAPNGSLALPVTFYGNAALVTRGESVWGEVIGTGDANQPNQVFELKKPLTYLPDPTEKGFVSTLTLRVDGIEVAEVGTLYGQPADAIVYTLRETPDGKTQIMFGDGIRAARLNTGALVTGDYRTGGGADRPPADSITQMVTPADAVTAVHQPFEAFGGSDPESEAELAINAPRAAFLLGRAISLADFEAAAQTQDGVLAAKSDWGWSDKRQRPVAYVWYAGEDAIRSKLSARLRNLTDPSTPIEVKQAVAAPIRLSLDVGIDPTFRSEDVLRALRDALTLPRAARLAHAHPKIGMALFRSPIIAEALAVAGVTTINAANLLTGPLPAEGMAAAMGTWFTIDPDLGGGLILNGLEEGP